MTLYYVHDDLRHQVKVFYSLDEAELNTSQYCYVHQIYLRPVVADALEAYNEKYNSFCEKLAS